MDEMRMVRDCYPEPAPPTAREIARAKALLTEPPRRPRPRLRWGLGAVTAAAVGTAAVVAITLPGGATPVRPNPAKTDAGGAILAAAEMAARQPAGDYWYVDQIQGQSFVVPATTGTYAITGARSETFSWWGAKRGMGESFWDRDLPAGPSTAHDVALWRRAGSPSTFRVWAGDHYDTFTTRSTGWKPDHPDPAGGGDFPGAGSSVAELRSLPTSPARLAQMFLSPTALRKAGLPADAGPGAEVEIVANLLSASPVPPKVRAGLMRALADQPGVHAIGSVTDPMGRAGVALASDDRATTVTGADGTPKADQGTYRSREVVIFDRRTGAVLAQEEVLTTAGGPYARMKPGFVIDYHAARSAAWTDTRPSPPAG